MATNATATRHKVVIPESFLGIKYQGFFTNTHTRTHTKSPSNQEAQEGRQIFAHTLRSMEMLEKLKKSYLNTFDNGIWYPFQWGTLCCVSHTHAHARTLAHTHTHSYVHLPNNYKIHCDLHNNSPS